MGHQPQNSGGATAPGPASASRSAGWFTDPLDEHLLRYWDGCRWTFYTLTPAAASPPLPSEPEKPQPAPTSSDHLRPDIDAAVHQVRGGLLGANKELRLLPTYLRPEEQVVAVCAANGEGIGVLAVTNQRLLFLFAGLLREQFLQVDWNAAREVVYFTGSKQLAVYTTRVTKRARPAFAVQVGNRADAERLAYAAGSAANAPRLDIG